MEKCTLNLCPNWKAIKQGKVIWKANEERKVIKVDTRIFTQESPQIN
jgi:hypothetical protein